MPGWGLDDGGNTAVNSGSDVDEGSIIRDVKPSWKSDERKAGSLGRDDSTSTQERNAPECKPVS